jgi:hypothetical protein
MIDEYGSFGGTIVELTGESEVVEENLNALCSINSTLPDLDLKLNLRCGKKATDRIWHCKPTTIWRAPTFNTKYKVMLFSHFPLHIRSVQHNMNVCGEIG